MAGIDDDERGSLLVRDTESFAAKVILVIPTVSRERKTSVIDHGSGIVICLGFLRWDAICFQYVEVSPMMILKPVDRRRVKYCSRRAASMPSCC